MDESNIYVDAMTSYLKDVDRLRQTPETIRAMGLTTLSSISVDKLPHEQQRSVRNGIAALENISEDSMAESFSAIYSQMCVLAVSIFEAQLKQFFEDFASTPGALSKNSDKLKSIKFSVHDLIEHDLNLGGKIGRLITQKENISFQDMGSVIRVFKDYFGKELMFEEDVTKRAIFYLECRHSLVHRGGVVDQKFMDAVTVRKANLHSYKLGDDISLDVGDWDKVGSALLAVLAEATRPIIMEPVVP